MSHPVSVLQCHSHHSWVVIRFAACAAPAGIRKGGLRRTSVSSQEAPFFILDRFEPLSAREVTARLWGRPEAVRRSRPALPCTHVNPRFSAPASYCGRRVVVIPACGVFRLLHTSEKFTGTTSFSRWSTHTIGPGLTGFHCPTDPPSAPTLSAVNTTHTTVVVAGAAFRASVRTTGGTLSG